MQNQNKENKGIFKLSRYFFYIFSIIILIAIGFLFYKVYKYYTFIELSSQIKDNLEKSVASFKEFDVERAQALAVQSKYKSKESLEVYNRIQDDFLLQMAFSQQESRDLKYILESSYLISKTLVRGSNLALEFKEKIELNKDLDFTEVSSEDKSEILKLLYKKSPEIQSIKANMELALFKLQQVEAQGKLEYLQQDVSTIKTKLQEQTRLASRATKFLEVLPYLSGYPQEKKVLVMLQNHDELRATGGFFGSYAYMTIDEGSLDHVESHDIYHLDSLVKDKIEREPPEPIEKYLQVNNWYFRDINWSPDWPKTVTRMKDYYAKIYEPNNEYTLYKPSEITNVVAINPSVIEDILGLVGEIQVEEETYTAENFQEVLQYEVEIGYNEEGIPDWNRKQEINKVLTKLKTKLKALPVDQYPELFQILKKNLNQKHILLHSSDSYVQNQILEKNWGGEVKQTDSDYFMLVDSNLGAYKSDAVVTKNIDYSVNRNQQGELIANFRVDYSHHGGFDWRTTRYRSYTRLLTPKGSELISAQGLSQKEADTYFNQDLNKKVLAGFISIEPQESGYIEFKYKLPEIISNSSDYSLYAQKQPGSRISQLKLDLSQISNQDSFIKTFPFTRDKHIQLNVFTLDEKDKK